MSTRFLNSEKNFGTPEKYPDLDEVNLELAPGFLEDSFTPPQGGGSIFWAF